MERPNVVVFFTDQQRWDTVGLHGNPLGLTPNFDRIARTGTHLTQTFSPQPVCGPARACMQTGRYATQTGCHRNGVPLPADEPTLGHRFANAGYATGYVGKWHLASQDPVPPNERGGYATWRAANLLEFTSRPYDTVVFDEDGAERKLPGYRVDALTDEAIRFVARQRSQPFFLFLSLLEPHHQNDVDAYPPPIGTGGAFEDRWVPPDLAQAGGTTARHLADYWAIAKRIDEAFGRLMDALHSLDLIDSTVVAFTSDHGCHFRTRNAEYKRSPHDASLRVPTLLTGPGFDQGRTVQKPVSLLDLPPTLLDAAGIEIPSTMAGTSLLPHVRGDGPPPRPEVFFQISESVVGRGIRTSRWKYAVEAPTADPFRDSDSPQYVESHLYDLEHDPYELVNLVRYPSHAELRAALRHRLLVRIDEAEGTRPTVEPASQEEPGYFDQRRVVAADFDA